MKVRNYIYLLLSVVGVACSSNLSDGDSLDGVNLQQVSISVGGASTRLAVNEDDGSNMSLRWEDNDAIYMWAESEAGVAFENTKFNILYYAEDYTDAIFTANIEPMSESTYIYRGAFPQPQEVSADGNELKYTISSTQSGEYSDSNDIMIIPKMEGAALTESVDRSMVMSFKHLTHMLRIEIPSGRNNLVDYNGLVDDIVSLTINFPRSIAGEGWVDFNNETFTLGESGSNSITVNLADAYTAGSGDYIWVAIAAGDVKGDISFSATSEGGLISQDVSSYIDGINMKEGEITALTITAGEIDFDRTYDYFTVSVGANNLGESVEDIILTAPSGALFSNGTNTVTLAYDYSTGKSENAYYIPTKYGDIFDAGSVGVQFNSANALVTGSSFAGSTIATDGSNVSADVPYLFYEDFSNLISFNSGDNEPVGGTDIASSDETVALSSHGLNQTGWTGDRIGSDGSGYIRLLGRAEIVFTGDTNYRGRLDTPALSGIKSGKSVKIKVEYNMGGAVSIGRYTGSGSCSFYGKYDYGYTTSTGTLAYDDGITTTNGGDKGVTVTGTSTTSNSYTSGITWYSSSSSYNITSVTSSTRITWRMEDSWDYTGKWYNSWSGNANAWLYLDNVKVSIVSN